eukprot:3236856-Rhodomonas_salina.1
MATTSSEPKGHSSACAIFSARRSLAACCLRTATWKAKSMSLPRSMAWSPGASMPMRLVALSGTATTLTPRDWSSWRMRVSIVDLPPCGPPVRRMRAIMAGVGCGWVVGGSCCSLAVKVLRGGGWVQRYLRL